MLFHPMYGQASVLSSSSSRARSKRVSNQTMLNVLDPLVMLVLPLALLLKVFSPHSLPPLLLVTSVCEI